MTNQGTSGTRTIKTDYPIEEGLTAGTTKLRKKPHLQAQERLTRQRKREGL